MVYSVNTVTSGVSRYTGGAWDGAVALARVQDKTLVLGPLGCYEHAGDDDDGAEISAFVETGALSFGEPSKNKFCHLVRLYGTAENGAKVTVVEYRDGVASEYVYVASDDGGQGAKAMSARTGKGIFGEALGLRVGNIGGGSLSIRGVQAEIFAGRHAR